MPARSGDALGRRGSSLIAQFGFQGSSLSAWMRGWSGAGLGKWGCSSVGRAVALQAIGQEFEPPYLHKEINRKTNMPKARCYTDNILRKVIPESKSISQVMRKIGMRPAGGSHCHLKRRIISLGLDTSHFTGRAHNKGMISHKRKTWQEILCKYEGARRPKPHLLKRALCEIGREYKCEACGNRGSWNGKLLVLEIDHKNRDRTNNLAENLSFLCPNCHSQTVGVNGRKRLPHRKPSKETLQGLIWKFPTTNIGTLFGVSDKAVEKWCKSYNLSKPSRGYWAKKKAGKI